MFVHLMRALNTIMFTFLTNMSVTSSFYCIATITITTSSIHNIYTHEPLHCPMALPSSPPPCRHHRHWHWHCTGTAPEDQGGGHHRPRPREEQWAENNVSKYHMAVAVSEYGSWCASRCKRGEDEGDGEGICEVQ